MILDLFIHIIQFYINQNTFLPGFIIRKRANLETPKVAPKIDPKIDPKNNDPN